MEYLNKEGVLLNYDEIVFNPALRQLGKAVITSFWRKLGKKENQEKASINKDPREFFVMFTNASIEINNILPVNDDTLLVNWSYKEESYNELTTVNVCLAAYTTAQARLKLYEYLETLGKRVLYYGIDSVIYTHLNGQVDIPLGSFLGDMTNELETYGPNSYITEFVCGGPKLYSYIVFFT